MKWFNPEGAESLSEEGGLLNMKKNRVDSKGKSATLISSDTSVRGDIHFSGRLYVSGAVTGKITTDEGVSATLLIDEGGSVEGDIEAAHVVIAGRVEGNVLARKRLEVAATARVRGNVSYKQLGVELGAFVNGKILCVEDDQESGNVRVFELPGDGDRDA